MKHWCECEKAWLEYTYPHMATKILAERFGTTYASIEAQALRQKLKKTKKARGNAISEGVSARNRSIEHKPTLGDHYVQIYAPDHPNKDSQNKIGLAVIVIEKKLGRYVEPWERVAHKDGNPFNNDPDNLYIFECVTQNSVDVAEIISKREHGVPVWVLKEEYGLTNATLYRILRKGGCKIRKINRKGRD